MARPLRLLPVLFLLPGCAAVTLPTAVDRAEPPAYEEIDRPGGLVSRSLTCPASLGDCYERATRACPEGYEVVSASAPAGVAVDGDIVSRYPGTFRGTMNIPGSLVVTCDRDRPEVRTHCDRAWDARDEVARAWAERRSRAPQKEVPEGTFLSVCRQLPVDAQRCLEPAYEGRHEARCARVLDGLGPTDVSLLDVALVARR